MSRAIRFRSSSTACRRASTWLCSARRLWCNASVACCAMASRSARRHALSQSEAGPVASATQPRLRVGSKRGAVTTDATPDARLKSCTGAGRRGSSPVYSIVAVFGVEAPADICHPQLAACRIRVEQPHAGTEALGLVDQRLYEGAKEAGHIRLP